MHHRFDRHQLRDRWHGQTQRKHTRKTGRWEPAEDQRLLQVWLGMARHVNEFDVCLQAALSHFVTLSHCCDEIHLFVIH